MAGGYKGRGRKKGMLWKFQHISVLVATFGGSLSIISFVSSPSSASAVTAIPGGCLLIIGGFVVSLLVVFAALRTQR